MGRGHTIGEFARPATLPLLPVILSYPKPGNDAPVAIPLPLCAGRDLYRSSGPKTLFGGAYPGVYGGLYPMKSDGKCGFSWVWT